jgi:hypothetical protein
VYLEYQKDNLSWKYGRLLAYVYLDKEKKQNFNQILVELGYARVYLKFPFKYEKYFLKAQVNAKKQKLWIWQNTKLKKEFLKEIKLEQEYKTKDLFNIDKLAYLQHNFWKLKKNIKKIKSYNLSNFSKDIWINKWFNWKPLKSKKTNLNFEKDLKTFEKQLKKSISYKISKNKNSFRISWISKNYKKIKLNFQWKNYILNTDKNWNFVLELKKVNSWEYFIEFFWLKDKKELFLKKSRKITLTKDYVNNIWKLKKKWRKKKIKNNIKSIENKLQDLNLDKTIKTAKNSLSLFDFKWFILKLLIWIIWVLLLFLILFRKKVLQNN